MCPDAENLLHAAVSSREALLRFHAPARIQGYCRSCEKFGLFWSCPPFTRSPLDDFPQWTHAVILCRRVPLPPGTARDAVLELFQSARVGFGEAVRRLEARWPGVTALVAGHCAGCPVCTRAQDEPCIAPERMRYSLEAVGFDVSGLAGALAGITLHWPKGGTPDYLTTVGALLCPEETIATELCAAARG